MRRRRSRRKGEDTISKSVSFLESHYNIVRCLMSDYSYGFSQALGIIISEWAKMQDDNTIILVFDENAAERFKQARESFNSVMPNEDVVDYLVHQYRLQQGDLQ